MFKYLIVSAAFLCSSVSFAEVDQSSRTDCLSAWKAVFVEGNISAGEASVNVAVAGTLGASATASGKISSTVRSVSKLVLLGGVVGGVALAANEQFAIIDQIFKQGLVGGGDLLTELGEAAKGTEFSSKAIAEKVASLDPRNADFGKYLCTESNQPVILGRYVEAIFEIK